MKNIKIRDLVDASIVAALYVAITLALYPISYGSIQFRVAESLVLLTYFNKKLGLGVIFGVLIANFFNPEFALIDCVFGTLSTVIAVMLITKTKNLFVASLMPTLTSIIVVFEVYYVTKISFYLCFLEIVLSMFIIESVIGFLLFKLLSKNKGFLKIIKVEREELKYEI